MRLSRIEIAIAIAAATLLGFVLARYAPGGPLSTDVLWYINVGLNGLKDPFILNRYFHVFLQLFFIRTAPTPLIGVQNFWAFLTAGAAFLIYVNARLCSSKSNALHGLLAVGFFFTLKDTASWAGTPWADMTAMVMVLLIITFYFLSIRSNNQIKWLVIILGVLVYLGFRTKEVVLITCLLLPGLGFTNETHFDRKLFLKNIAYLFAGVIAGVFIYGVLGWIILKDPFFGLRLSEIQEFKTTYLAVNIGGSIQPGTDNWYTAFALEVVYVPFILYVISGIRTGAESPLPYRLAWLIPLFNLLYVIFILVNRSGFVTRFVLPGLAAIFFLAPQFLESIHPATTRGKVRLGLVLVAGLLLPVLVRFGIRPLVYRAGMDFGQFLEIMFHPVILTILLATLFLSKRSSVMNLLVEVMCVSGLMISPLISNARMMFLDRPAQTLSRFQFYPFSQFDKEIHYSPGMQMYVSSNISDNTITINDMGSRMLSDDRIELACMFNVYFNARANRYNFTFSYDSPHKADDILAANYTYVLLTTQDWQGFTAHPAQLAQIEAKYQVFHDTENLVVFLIAH